MLYAIGGDKLFSFFSKTVKFNRKYTHSTNGLVANIES